MSLFKISAVWKQPGWIFAVVAVMIAALLLAGCGTAAPGAAVTPAPALRLPASSSVVQVAPLFDESTAISLYEKCIPAVVQVESVASVPAPFLPHLASISPR